MAVILEGERGFDTNSVLVAADIGGTFTDLVALDPRTGRLEFAKSLTTPPDFEQGILDCLEQARIEAARIDVLRHGTTVVINALLERKGARTALVTTAGFRDVLELGRGNRPEAFNLLYRRPPPVVPREHRLEIVERLNAQGDMLTPLDEAALPVLAETLASERIEAVAVCLLHAWRNPVHEQRIGAFLRQHTGCFVTCSHEISREFREFERTSTVAFNAFVGPGTGAYLARMEAVLGHAGFAGRLFLMGSNGGVLATDDARQRPLLLVESGPVGGVAGAIELGNRTGNHNLVAFDMGGTTAKAVLIEDGEAAVTPLYWVGGYDRGYPVQAAVLDIVEVGSGGGSIAAMNEFGALEVGPRSAGASPGPACYGRGGTDPTVTDANLFLGRLDPAGFLGGSMPLRPDLGEAALAGLAERLRLDTTALASGIIRIATLNMATAVRKVTIERGHDPRDFCLVGFGGAGPLHTAEVARELGIERLLIPPNPGHFSAFGMLFADFRYDLTETVARPLDDVDAAEIEARFAALERQGAQRLETIGVPIHEIRYGRYAEMRYQRQEYALRVRLPSQTAATGEMRQLFEASYRHRFGRAAPASEIDLVMLRLVVEGRATRAVSQPPTARAVGTGPDRRPVWFPETGTIAAEVWRRDALAPGDRLAGPAVIEEAASTTLLGPGDTSRIDDWGNIAIMLGAAG